MNSEAIIAEHHEWLKRYQNSYFRRWAGTSFIMSLIFWGVPEIVWILTTHDSSAGFLAGPPILFAFFATTHAVLMVGDLQHQQSLYSPDHPNYNGG